MNKDSKEFEKLPKGWTWFQLSKVLERLESGKRPRGGVKDILSGIPSLGGEHLDNNGGFDFTNTRFVPEDFANSMKKGWINENDILVVKDGATTAKTSFVSKSFPFKKAVINEHVYICRAKKEFNPKWIFFNLWSEEGKKKILTDFRGAAQGGISSSFADKVYLPVPPYPIQQKLVEKIEELFSELDNAVENLRKAKEQLQTYRQAVLKAAFEGKLTAEWREKQTNLPTAEELLAKIKEERHRYYEGQLKAWQEEVKKWEAEGKPGRKPVKPKKPKELPPLTKEVLAELPELPHDWIWIPLNETGELARGKSKHRPRNDLKLFGGDYPFIQTGDVKAAHIKIKEYSQTYNEIGLSQSKLWPVGTLCITIAANIAETAFLDFSACFPDSIVGFTSYRSIMRSEYVFHFINHAKQKIEAFAPATAQKNINLKTLENLMIPYCSTIEQEQIVSEIDSRLSIENEVISTIDIQLRKIESLRQSILKKAFSGNLINSDEQETNIINSSEGMISVSY